MPTVTVVDPTKPYRDPITNILYPTYDWYKAEQSVKSSGLIPTTENIKSAMTVSSPVVAEDQIKKDQIKITDYTQPKVTPEQPSGIKPPPNNDYQNYILSGGKWVSKSDYSTGEVEEVIGEGEETPEQKQAKQTQADLDKLNKDYDSAMTDLDSMRISLKDSTSTLVNAIKEKMNVRRGQVEDIYMRSAGAYTTRGARLGWRYSQSLTGVLTANENAKVTKLKEIDADETNLIAEANQAYLTEDYKLFNQKVEMIDKKREEKITELKDLNKIIAENDKTLKEEKTKLENENAIITLFDKGINNITDIYKVMNQAGYKVSIKDIGDALTLMEKEPELKTQVVEIAGKKSLINIQTGEVIKELGDVSPKELKTEVIELPDKTKALINKETGEIIKSYGAGLGGIGGYTPGNIVDPKNERSTLKSIVDELPVGQQDSAYAAIQSFKSADELVKLLNDGLQTGWASALGGKVGQVTGRSSSQFNEFLAGTTAFTAFYIKALSGVQVSDKERKFLMNAMPSVYKQENVNRDNVKMLLGRLKDKYETQLNINFEDFPTELPMSSDNPYGNDNLGYTNISANSTENEYINSVINDFKIIAP